MKKIIPIVFAATMGLGLGLSPALAAEEAPLSKRAEQAEKALRESADKMLRAIEGLIQSIPQFEPPKMLDNGDIIIRRKNPDPQAKPADPPRTLPEDDHTQT